MNGIIDPAAMQRLLQTVGGDKTFLYGLIDDFFVDAPNYLAQMHSALNGRNAEELRRVTHGLKSNSASLGVTQLARLCAELEAQCKQGKLENAEEQLAQIQAEYANAQRALEAFKAQA